MSRELDRVREVAQRNQDVAYPLLVCVFAFDPRQEPSAVVPLAGICAGGRPQGRSPPNHNLPGERGQHKRAPDTEPEPVRVKRAGPRVLVRRRANPALDLSEEPSAGRSRTLWIGGPGAARKGRSLPRPSGAREGAYEALTGARVGRAIEPRNHLFGVPTPSPWWKATWPVALCESLAGPARSKNHGMHGTSKRENREIPTSCPAGYCRGAAQGTLRR